MHWVAPKILKFGAIFFMDFPELVYLHPIEKNANLLDNIFDFSNLVHFHTTPFLFLLPETLSFLDVPAQFPKIRWITRQFFFLAE